MFTQEEYDRLVEAMKSGEYVKNSVDFVQWDRETGIYSYCILGLAAHVNGQDESYYYEESNPICIALVDENDKEDDKDFIRMLACVERYKDELIDEGPTCKN